MARTDRGAAAHLVGLLLVGGQVVPAVALQLRPAASTLLRAGAVLPTVRAVRADGPARTVRLPRQLDAGAGAALHLCARAVIQGRCYRGPTPAPVSPQWTCR